MAEEVADENDQISKFEGLVTLTLDGVILHTIVHYSSTSTYMPNFTEIEETFRRRTYVRTDEHLRPALLGRLCRTVDLTTSKPKTICKFKNCSHVIVHKCHT